MSEYRGVRHHIIAQKSEHILAIPMDSSKEGKAYRSLSRQVLDETAGSAQNIREAAKAQLEQKSNDE